MRWQFWKSSNRNELPENVRNALMSEFRLEPQAVSQLRILTKSGQYSGRPVRYFQVFDPSLINSSPTGSLKYEQLEKGEHRKALLFAGRIEKTGEIYLTDHRPKAASVE